MGLGEVQAALCVAHSHSLFAKEQTSQHADNDCNCSANSHGWLDVFYGHKFLCIYHYLTISKYLPSVNVMGSLSLVGGFGVHSIYLKKAAICQENRLSVYSC